MFGAFEFTFHQAQTGSLPSDVWERWSRTMEWWPSFPGVRAWWHARPAPFTDTFTRFVDGLAVTASPDPEQQARWERFVSEPEAGP